MPGTSLEAFVGGLTVADLANRSGKSVQQIVDWSMGGQTARATTATAPTNGAATPSAKRVANREVNTRNAQGRAAYDSAVLEQLSGRKRPVSASSLRKKVGGTPLQMRTTMNRLIGAGKVSYEGKARAMVYSIR